MQRRGTRASQPSRTAIPCGPTTSRRSGRSHSSSESTSSSSARRRRSLRDWPTSYAIAASPCSGPAPAAQDYKRIDDGDEGPNTGGMGSYSPVPRVSDTEVAELVESVCTPVLVELARRGSPFAGVLFAGVMLTDDGPRVLEFNCRF